MHAPSKKPLQTEHYKYVAAMRIATHKCAVDGRMDMSLAAYGAAHIEWLLQNRITYDQDLLNERMKQAETMPITAADCNEAALEIHKMKQQDAANERIAAQQAAEQQRFIEATRINKPIFCGKAGFMVLCN
jgi:hypothetical protein